MARKARSPLLSVPLAALIALIYLHMKPLKIYGRNFSWPWRMLKALKVWIKEGLQRWGHCPSSKFRVHFCICLADFWRAGGRSSCLAWLWSPACPGPAQVPPGNPAPAQVPPPHRRFSTGWHVHWLHFRRTCSIYVVPLQAKPLINILHTF